MKLSNLRIERQKDDWSRLVVDVEAGWTTNSQLWVATPVEYESYLTSDVYDSFLVAAIWPAMVYNENIEIDGEVSPRLFYNIQNYVQHAIKAFRLDTSFVDVKVKGVKVAEQIGCHVATGFSAGIDAFATVIDRYVDEVDCTKRIDTFAFFNVGSHGGGRKEAREIFDNRYDLIKGYPSSEGLPFIKLDSNLYDFYEDHWEYFAGCFTRAFGCLAFQRQVKYYYCSGEYSYYEHMTNLYDISKSNMDEMAELYIWNLLSTERMELILEGAQYSRMEKTIKVAAYEPARQYLNVCINHWGDSTVAENCSHCLKCTRTMLSLDIIGKLDCFSDLFDVEWFRKNRKKLWIKDLKNPHRKDFVKYAKIYNYELMSDGLCKCYQFVQRLYHPIWKILKVLRIK